MFLYRRVISLFIMSNSLGSRSAWWLIIVALLALQAVGSLGDELTGEQKEEAKRAYKKLMLERLFDTKSITNKLPTNVTNTPNTKLKVPRAILEAYLKTREEVRHFIPDDQSFYGWINVDAYNTQENMWSLPTGDYDIEITMPTLSESFNSDDFRTENAKHIAHITLARDPEEIPAHIEKILPPHLTDAKFTSVHLKYNLSQGIYSSPTAVDDFKLAKLYLNREKVNLCNLQRCRKNPMPFFNDHNQSQKVDDIESDANNFSNLYQYQSVYILTVNGYDGINEPITRIHSSKMIDITQTSTLEFDITDIVREWLQDPQLNHGIIVRVSQRVKRISKIKRDIHTNLLNFSEPEVTPVGSEVVEHVRLKRSFQNYSDSLEVWLEKQPSLIIWSDPSPQDSPRHHVKRHHKEEDHQADEPDHTTPTDQLTSTRLPTSTDETSQQTTQVSPTGKSSSTTTSGLHGKRDHIPTTVSSSTRRGSQQSRTSSNSRPSSQQSGRSNKTRGRASGKTMFCGVHSLLINFEEVGWAGWIIAPHSYYANYCSGDCSWPLSDAQNATNRAIIQAIYHSVGRRVPKSCCAPVKLGPMAILYQLDGIVQMKRYDDMIVEACGCL